MKKACITLITFIAIQTAGLATPIVELSAPRTGGEVTELDFPIVDKSVEQKPAVVVPKKNVNKTRVVKKKPKLIKTDYSKISTLIEYGYYDKADFMLKNALGRNSKDIKAKALLAVSLAKQKKLDPAQSLIDNLLQDKKAQDNSDLHYAQGLVYLNRTTSSNMFYRANSEDLFDKALVEFKKAMDIDSKNAKAFNGAGVILMKQNKIDDAKKYFEQSLEADKTFSNAIDNLGVIDYLNENYEAADKKFQKALVENTQNTTAMYHIAQVAYKNKDYVIAIKYLNNALAIDSNNPAFFHLIAKCYNQQGNESAAVIALKKSTMIKPEFASSYMQLAKIYETRGDREFAIDELKSALSIMPDCHDATLKIADISLDCGNYKQATEMYSKLIGIDDYNEQALKGLANTYFYQAQTITNKALIGSNRNFFKALDYINKAIESNGDDLELHLAKLKLTKITNQPILSQTTLNEIVNSPKTDMTSIVIKGEAYLTLNNYEQARKMFASAIDLTKNTDEDFYLSEIFIYQKQYDSADKILRKILKADPTNQEAKSSLDYIEKSRKFALNHFNSAQYFIKAKNYPSAIEYLSRSLAIDPNNAQAHLLLAQLNEKQRNLQDAVSNYKAYLGLNPNAKDKDKICKKIEKLNNRL